VSDVPFSDAAPSGVARTEGAQGEAVAGTDADIPAGPSTSTSTAADPAAADPAAADPADPATAAADPTATAAADPAAAKESAATDPAATATSTSGIAAVPIAKMIHGVDVASFQGEPGNWRSDARNIKWAAVKLTELQPDNVRYVNPYAADDWAFVGRQKLGRIAYMFAHPSVGPADSVQFFLSELRGLGLLNADGIMLDLEQTDGLGPAQVSSWAVEVMALLAKYLKRTPILYTYLSFAYEGNCAGLGKYPLWISDPSSPMGKPVVPGPWKTWTIHQYSTSGVIDLDVANFATVKAMQEAFGVELTPPPKPQKGNLGGSVTGGVSAVRWGDGSIVVAGLDGLDHVQVRRYDGGSKTWGVWWNPAGTTVAVGPPALLSWGESYGQLYFAVAGGEVMEFATEDTGKTWAS
jgi:GH25 family lysozyme M1 (1,4-beta-N-acetylmuramidase)